MDFIVAAFLLRLASYFVPAKQGLKQFVPYLFLGPPSATNSKLIGAPLELRTVDRTNVGYKTTALVSNDNPCIARPNGAAIP